VGLLIQPENTLNPVIPGLTRNPAPSQQIPRFEPLDTGFRRYDVYTICPFPHRSNKFAVNQVHWAESNSQARCWAILLYPVTILIQLSTLLLVGGVCVDLSISPRFSRGGRSSDGKCMKKRGLRIARVQINGPGTIIIPGPPAPLQNNSVPSANTAPLVPRWRRSCFAWA
jgi:hypothetical protein